MPLAKTFWSPSFGMLKDKFGLGWMVMVATEETTPIPGADRFFVYDPDGNRVEFIEWQRPYEPA